ncbi:cellulose synthase like [Rhynchospora pubera]|uniref:glucomannan 4-beta-mannosyltransferase n=1 Tax=Rhynchospora pubera TaxID=906938 RepID=A0AAV8D097_9POAL|nr:cellulose synthase like [Rhynchospora pubera]
MAVEDAGAVPLGIRILDSPLKGLCRAVVFFCPSGSDLMAQNRSSHGYGFGSVNVLVHRNSQDGSLQHRGKERKLMERLVWAASTQFDGRAESKYSGTRIDIGGVSKDLVQLECKIWASKGKNIFYEVRDNRKGYKAGALKKGMEYSYAQKCDFVAIFDADFQPESDFLMRTIPFLMHNPKIGLVQARWQFVNPNECLMTRIQRMTLDYHFKVEQEAGSSVFSFFGFNGTAGVWRISAINEAGGWKDRTTVEDMDLAVRACLKGWQFVYVGDVKVKSELPSTLKAYRNQQHRWTCGAANLFRKMSKEILATREVSIWRKVYLLYSFFFVRKVVAHLVTFFLYCVVVPVSVLVPEVSVPVWGVAYIPTTITLLNAIRNPRLIHFIPFWILFENVMSMHRMKATFIGLFETGRVNEWVVTEKLGEAVSTKPEPQILEKPSFRLRARIKLSEIGFAVFLFFCACCDLFYGGNYYFVYIYLQSISFLVVGLGYVGKYVSNS